jgi:hypothetical protein
MRTLKRTATAFYTIIQKCLNVQHTLFPSGNCHEFWKDIYIINSNTNSEIHLFFYHYITTLYLKSNNNSRIKEKFAKFKAMIDNVFISEELKEEIIALFCKTQKTYYGFSRFAYIYKYKKSQYVIKNDLYLNEIDEDKTNVFTLYQDNSKYLFQINDLINIINNNLSNSPNFFVNPKVSKNPYNNMPLTHTSLYNIYFFIKNRNGIMPELFHHYFMCNFNIDLFSQNYECLIRNTAIRNYVNVSNCELLYSEIKIMLRIYAKKIRIHKDFPVEKIINIMRPYLHLYYLEKYAINGTAKKYESGNLLEKKMRLFYSFNPQFGRKYIRFLSKPVYNFDNKDNKRKRYPSVTIFNDKHISFNETPEELDIISETQDMREYGFNDIANYVLDPIQVEVLRFNRYYILLNERDVGVDDNLDN